MNIVVLAGGLSNERDVSLSSGAMAANALMDMGHHAVLVDLFFGVESLPSPVSDVFLHCKKLPSYKVPKVAPDIDAIKASRKSGFSASIGNGVLELCQAADITYLALHGDCGEDGSLQAFFDMSDVKYTGSPSIGCALAMNKFVSKQLLNAAGLLTPACVLLKKNQAFSMEDIPMPCVVKPCSGGSSIGISIVHDKMAFDAALQNAFRYEEEVLVEEYVRGHELSAGILGEEALPLIEIIPKDGFYDYANKYQPGLTTEITPARFPADVTARIQADALKGFRALQLSIYGRLDFLLTDEGKAYCLEANTLPGMTPTSLLPQEAAAVGIDYPTLCDKIVRMSLLK